MDFGYICLMYLTAGGYCYPVFYNRRTLPLAPEKASLNREEPENGLWDFNEYASKPYGEEKLTTVAANLVNEELLAVKKIANILSVLGEQEDSGPMDKSSVMAENKNSLWFENETSFNYKELSSTPIPIHTTKQTPSTRIYFQVPSSARVLTATEASEIKEDIKALKKVAQILVLLGETVIPQILEGRCMRGCAQKVKKYGYCGATN